MDPVRMMTSTCTLVRVTQTVTEGDLDETTATETSACAIFPKSQTEAGGRTVVESEKWDGFFPGDVDLNGVDRIVYAGDTYELAGRPGVWPAMGSIASYVQATLVRTA